jgi:hypothetical protein
LKQPRIPQLLQLRLAQLDPVTIGIDQIKLIRIKKIPLIVYHVVAFIRTYGYFGGFLSHADILLISKMQSLFHTVLTRNQKSTFPHFLVFQPILQHAHLLVDLIQPSFVILSGQHVIEDLFFEVTIVGLEFLKRFTYLSQLISQGRDHRARITFLHTFFDHILAQPLQFFLQLHLHLPKLAFKFLTFGLFEIIQIFCYFYLLL